MISAVSLWPHLQDRRRIDGKVRCCRSPRDTELAGCPVRVTITIIFVTHAVVAILDGQDVSSPVGLNMGGEKVNLTYLPLPIVRDRGALPPPLRFVVAPHLQDGSCHLHARFRRGEDENLPMQVSRPVHSFLVAILIPQANSLAIAG